MLNVVIPMFYYLFSISTSEVAYFMSKLKFKLSLNYLAVTGLCTIALCLKI